jgi:hypothetical protein
MCGPRLHGLSPTLPTIAVVSAVNAVARIEMLTKPAHLVELSLVLITSSAPNIVDPSKTGHAFMRAIANRLRNLQTLELHHAPPPFSPCEDCPANSNSADDVATATDNVSIAYDQEGILLLRHLHALTALNISSVYFLIDETAWFALLKGMPWLQTLVVNCYFDFLPACAFLATR